MNWSEVTKNDERIERLAMAIDALGDAFSLTARATYPDVPAEAQTVRDLQITLQSKWEALIAERQAVRDRWEAGA